jgi:hemerythrin-like metal-binding protein
MPHRSRPPLPVGVPLLDSQHRQLHSMLLSLIQTLECQPGGANAGERFVQISEAISAHFKAEEHYLEEVGYPDLIPHRFEHQALVEQFRDKLARWNTPGAPPLVNLVREVAETSIRHILRVDRAYAEWLRSEAVRKDAKASV